MRVLQDFFVLFLLEPQCIYRENFVLQELLTNIKEITGKQQKICDNFVKNHHMIFF